MRQNYFSGRPGVRPLHITYAHIAIDVIVRFGNPDSPFFILQQLRLKVYSAIRLANSDTVYALFARTVSEFVEI